MINIAIPGYGDLSLTEALFDFNGTLAVDGIMSEETKRMLIELSNLLTVHIATAGTHGGLDAVKIPGISLELIRAGGEAQQKLAILKRLDPARTVAAGNGANDRLMLDKAALAIGVLGSEGIFAPLLAIVDITVSSPTMLLGLLLNPKRIVATLRR